MNMPRGKRDRVFCLIDKDGFGLEIGPSYSPYAPKSQGYAVEIVDHLDTDSLRKKYNYNPRIEEVDYVFDGRSLVEAIGSKERYDWIIASHVIEHVPDVIAFLQDCEALLKPEGVLSLVVPDKRFCFDRFRPHTDASVAIDAHFEGRKRPSPGAVAAGLLYNVFNGGKHSFSAESWAEFQVRFTAEQAKRAMHAARNEYKDCHVWCFTPASFRLLLLDLKCLGFTSLQEATLFPTDTNGSDFIVLLKKSETQGPSREQLMADLEDDLRGGLVIPAIFGNQQRA
ncbi:class I SAM-dependent methyltransferase [Ensifer sesbaniae]|uniref:methyltransferase domain-containing protein n=1 Tax=Ensifer sesbaniae TaxID=1214071 RepID=UPI00200169C5|nr:class I SAM-dependent methyltransferase [Ensifer sesbaniae]